jgi:hypothetical protein
MFSNWGFPLSPPDPPQIRLAGGCGEPQDEPDGICEVITVPAMDELPYVFELQAGETLNATITSEQQFDLMLCNDAVYDAWIDSGMPTPLPHSYHLIQTGRSTHTVSFQPVQRGHYVLLLVNPSEEPIEVVFNAKTG